jgi:hypothetical protein
MEKVHGYIYTTAIVIWLCMHEKSSQNSACNFRIGDESHYALTTTASQMESEHLRVCPLAKLLLTMWCFRDFPDHFLVVGNSSIADEYLRYDDLDLNCQLVLVVILKSRPWSHPITIVMGCYGLLWVVMCCCGLLWDVMGHYGMWLDVMECDELWQYLNKTYVGSLAKKNHANKNLMPTQQIVVLIPSPVKKSIQVQNFTVLTHGSHQFYTKLLDLPS